MIFPDPENLRKYLLIASSFCIIIGAGVFSLAVFQLYVPRTSGDHAPIMYEVQGGIGSAEIARDLKAQGIIRSEGFFKLYAIISGNHTNLKAGRYEFSPSSSIVSIVSKIAKGETVKSYITFPEGWNAIEMASALEDRRLISGKAFLELTGRDWSERFSFLKDKPNDVSLEGYLFPDTYQISDGSNAEALIKAMLSNFDKKLTPELRAEIARQNKSIFEVVTMASILEKEVRSLQDKKIVAGILWKRMEEGIPLQVDASVNYITHKGHSRVTIADTQIDSPYNTYRYAGLPKGPISNPGIESVQAALQPIASPYWYYLSANGTGETIFSSTLEEHNIARVKYLNS